MADNISLHELNNNIKNSLSVAFPEQVWVVAEINELNQNKSGHCYLELIEKDNKTDEIVAKARATIWSYTFRLLKPYFETTTGRDFSSGLKVLLLVKVEFHELYGYSLNIHDIDPAYTIGDLALQRRKTIEKLKEEGVFFMNKELTLPYLPSKIAIISSKTAAGYQDFIDQLKHNSYGYKYYTKLFPSTMQGNDATESITNSLNRIYDYEDFFDVVVLIRGGGSQSDLSCFDNYWLANHVAQFPIPILTGIGHDKDESVTDLVAKYSLKTPTAVAEYLINKYLDADNYLTELYNLIVNEVNIRLDNNKRILNQISLQLVPVVQTTITRQVRILNKFSTASKLSSDQYMYNKRNYLHDQVSFIEFHLKKIFMKSSNEIYNLKKTILFLTRKYSTSQQHKLHLIGQSLGLLDPQQVLKRGYSLTYSSGKIVRNSAMLTIGQSITTKFSKGKVNSIVKKVILEQNGKSNK